MSESDIESRAVNVIRGLAMDAPQHASSGHPGTAMALAPLAHVLWSRVMRHDPAEPRWPDRDRFILSCGHASILLYSMLYLNRYGLTLDDLRSFRQWASATPGHPEANHDLGIEVTTGPLGQGFANGVGMGIAERWLRARFGPELCDHHTFVICSDGDLEEGVSHEAASLAGHLGLGRLVYVYDDNHISIDGPTDLAYSDDVPARFRAYGWHVDDVGEIANDLDGIEAALRRAMAVADRPSLIVLRSHIGWPSPHRTDTAAAHGEPLGADEVAATKKLLGLPIDEEFWVPEDVLAFYSSRARRHQESRRAWQARLDGTSREDQVAYAACLAGRGIEGWAGKLPSFEPGDSVATRRALNVAVRATSDVIPGLVAGSADLTGNTGMALAGAADQARSSPGGSQVHYGIREHGMGSAMTGMALHGGIVPVGGTFFVFSDYMRPAVRIAALSRAHVIYSWTHDSIGLGEDGPTHQPVEQLAAMRAMPGLRVIRPADANECAHAWRVAVDGDGPTALVLSRQGLPVLAEVAPLAGNLARGAYVVSDPPAGRSRDVVLVGTGSELQLCIEAAAELQGAGIAARVVSFPSWELYEEQDDAYRASVLPRHRSVPTLAVEAASSFGWDRYADETVTIDRFGASAPGAVTLDKLGFTIERVVARARALVAGTKEET